MRGKFDFLALVVKFGFWEEVITAFCKMRCLVGVVDDGGAKRLGMADG